MRPVQSIIETRDIRARAITHEEIERLRKLFEVTQFLAWCAMLSMTEPN